MERCGNDEGRRTRRRSRQRSQHARRASRRQGRASIAEAIERAIECFGRIDALINNAGFGFPGIFETIPPEKIQ